MTNYQFRPAVRAGVPLLLGLAGGTGSGKTWSAMVLAQAMSGGKRFAVVDTENGRAKHYADHFQFDSADLGAPFRPERYAEAIQAADAAGYDVIVVDSMSHEWAGDGGILDWQEEEFQRMGGRDAVKMASWIKPKQGHRKFVTKLLQVRAHVILCFRAAERVEMVRNAQGKMEVVPKKSLTGLDGWEPITERNLPFELTASFLLTADAPGVPKPIKLNADHRPFFPLDRPITAEAGTALAQWAAGGEASAGGPKAVEGADGIQPPVSQAATSTGGSMVAEPASPAEELKAELIDVCAELNVDRDVTQASIDRAAESRTPDQMLAWLRRQLKTARENLEARNAEVEQTSFADMIPAGVREQDGGSRLDA